MRVAVLDDFQQVALTCADWGPVTRIAEVDVFADHDPDPGRLVTRLMPYDAVVLMRERTPFPSTVIEALPNLRLIVTTGRANAAIDLAAAQRRGITVCGTESLASAPAELTWALILGLARHLPTEIDNMRAGRWQSTIGRGLAGRTLGVVGLGRVGSRVATVGAALGMNVVAWSRSLTADRAETFEATAVDLEPLLVSSDVVTLHLPLTQDTRGLIDEDRIALMKPSALLVNTARAGLLDLDAAMRAVTEGRLAGLGLDVFELEPLPADHALRSTPRVLTTPHLGYVADDVYALFFTQAVEDIVAFAQGNPVRAISQRP
jgi:phosphoglycerate dehydrogenase-like enzyme